MDNKQEIKLQAFEMHKNLYFIGSEAVSVHLINTEQGLVLIDTGYPNMYDLILDNIKKMGFAPKDICAIFHTHGHIDHFGTTQKLVNLSGAKTYISRIDNDIVNGNLDLSWAKEVGLERLPYFNCDILIEDGDIFSFGNTQIRCVHTPGHTEGVMSFIITLENEGKNTVAAMHGGIGTNSMSAEFLTKYGLSFDCRDKFKEGLKRLSSENVDLVLGNHPEQSNTKRKMIRVMNGETDLTDKGEWQRFLDSAEKRINALLEKEAQTS